MHYYDIILTEHARERMEQRGVGEWDIQYALNHGQMLTNRDPDYICYKWDGVTVVLEIYSGKVITVHLPWLWRRRWW